MNPPIKVLIFGATGMAGNGVTQACLASPDVAEVRAIVRRPLPYSHPKLRVFLHDDFTNYSRVKEAFTGVDACMFCLGISSTQVSGEAEYRAISYDFPLAASKMLQAQSPGAPLHYISGQGTNINSRLMWSRVKGKTEQDLMQAGGVAWRPAIIDTPPSDSVPRIYRALLPLVRLAAPLKKFYVTGADLGLAMVQATLEKIHGRVVENPEIRELAARNKSA